MNLFYESSTRTSSSFELAAKRLSADLVSVRSTGSAVDKGESLRDTIATLSAYDPAAIVIRAPWAGAARIVAEQTNASVVNAGDGKHEHPSQALLDVYTLRRRLGSLDGADDLDRRRRAPQPSRALQHPRVHAHGRARDGVRAADPDPAGRRQPSAARCATTSTRLGDADVVYALRMQRERMGDAFVPSLREYVSCYQIDSRRLEPRQLLMHPGPVNRGVELAAEVIDSPQALIIDQVAAGLVVRMAILYELLSGGAQDGAPGGVPLRPVEQPA